MRIIMLSIVLILSGCATEGNYRKALDTWIGKPETDLVSKWGAPDSAYSTGDIKLISYSRQAATTGMVSYGVLYTQAHGCKTTFTINNIGIVDRYLIEGNNCKSR